MLDMVNQYMLASRYTEVYMLDILVCCIAKHSIRQVRNPLPWRQRILELLTWLASHTQYTAALWHPAHTGIFGFSYLHNIITILPHLTHTLITHTTDNIDCIYKTNNSKLWICQLVFSLPWPLSSTHWWPRRNWTGSEIASRCHQHQNKNCQRCKEMYKQSRYEQISYISW